MKSHKKKAKCDKKPCYYCAHSINESRNGINSESSEEFFNNKQKSIFLLMTSLI